MPQTRTVHEQTGERNINNKLNQPAFTKSNFKGSQHVPVQQRVLA